MDVKSNKIISYIGFALKSGKYKKGVYSVGRLGSAEVVIVSAVAGENSLKEAVTAASRMKCPVVKANSTDLGALLHSPDCKLIAITDKNLAKAILENLNDDFTLMNGGGKL